MTVIAWDGHTLAADKQMTCYGLSRVVTKIFKTIDGSLVGFTGSFPSAMQALAWFNDPERKPENYPQFKDNDSHVTALRIDKDGKIWEYSSGFPLLIEDSYHAVGSGRDFALAAMYCGNSSIKAVEIATHFETGCGNGIDALELEAV